MNKFLIRKLDFPKDSPALYKFLDTDEVDILKKVPELMRDKISKCHVAIIDSCPVGWVLTHFSYPKSLSWEDDNDTNHFFAKGNCYLGNLDVHESFRRKGIANALLKKSYQSARHSNRSQIWLHVNTENKPAIQLYESLEWKREKLVTPSWYKSGSMFLYNKRLDDINA